VARLWPPEPSRSRTGSVVRPCRQSVSQTPVGLPFECPIFFFNRADGAFRKPIGNITKEPRHLPGRGLQEFRGRGRFGCYPNRRQGCHFLFGMARPRARRRRASTAPSATRQQETAQPTHPQNPVPNPAAGTQMNPRKPRRHGACLAPAENFLRVVRRRANSPPGTPPANPDENFPPTER
jgi:hypothetical protein